MNINPQSNTDFTQVTCTVHFYYKINLLQFENDQANNFGLFQLSVNRFTNNFLRGFLNLCRITSKIKLFDIYCFVYKLHAKPVSSRFLIFLLFLLNV